VQQVTPARLEDSREQGVGEEGHRLVQRYRSKENLRAHRRGGTTKDRSPQEGRHKEG